MTESLPSSSEPLSHAPAVDVIVTVVSQANYKMSSPNVVRAVHSVRPDIPRSTIQRTLTRLVTNASYADRRIKREGTKGSYVYFFENFSESTDMLTDKSFELSEFFVEDQPVCVHDLHLIVEDQPIDQDRELEVPFLDYVKPISFQFYKSTGNILIYFNCADWTNTLTPEKLQMFEQTVFAVLRARGLAVSREEIYIKQLHINQDDRRRKLAVSNYVSLEAYANLNLVLYNKGDGMRKEAQMSFKNETISLNKAVNHLLSAVDRMYIEKTLGRANLLFDKIEHNTSVLKNKGFNVLEDLQRQATYGFNVINSLDNQLVQLNKQTELYDSKIDSMLANQVKLNEHTEALTFYTQDLKKELEETKEVQREHFTRIEEQIKEIPVRKKDKRTHKKQERILSILEKSSFTKIGELAEELDLSYHTTRYHLKKLVEQGRIEEQEGETTGRGRPYKVYRKKTKENEKE